MKHLMSNRTFEKNANLIYLQKNQQWLTRTQVLATIVSSAAPPQSVIVRAYQDFHEKSRYGEKTV